MSTTARIQALVAAELGKPAAEIAINDELTADLGAHALDVLRLVMQIEDEFGISVGDDEINGLRTVGDLIALVERPPPERGWA